MKKLNSDRIAYVLQLIGLFNMGIDSEISIIQSSEEEKQIFQRWKLLLMNKIRSCKYGKDGMQRDKKNPFIPTRIWKTIKRYSRPKNRQAWTQKAVALHIFSYTHQHLSIQKAFFCLCLYWNVLESAVQAISQ